eukprot:s434_g1.t1
MNNLAELLRQQGKMEEAEHLYRRSLAGEEVTLGAQHPRTMSAMNSLAFLLKDQGKLLEAESLWRRCLEGEEAQRGPNHPDTLLKAMNLGVFLRDLGRLDESMVAITKRRQKAGEIGSDSNENMVQVAQGLRKSSFPDPEVSSYIAILSILHTEHFALRLVRIPCLFVEEKPTYLQ